MLIVQISITWIGRPHMDRLIHVVHTRSKLLSNSAVCKQNACMSSGHHAGTWSFLTKHREYQISSNACTILRLCKALTLLC